MTPDQLAAAIRHAVVTAIADGAVSLEPAQVPDEVTVERPRNPEHGDYATNVALQLAKAAGMQPAGRRRGWSPSGCAPPRASPRSTSPVPASSTSRSTPRRFGELARSVVVAGEAYGRVDRHAGEHVNVEFISANPTGPLHLGHTRWAAVGDAIARVLEAAGAEVTREFYVNDRGVQMDQFGQSLEARGPRHRGAGGRLPGRVHRRARAADRRGRPGHRRPRRRRAAGSRSARRATPCSCSSRRTCSTAFNTHFDVWYSERTLHSSGAVERGLDKLREQGHMFEADGAVWLRTTDFDDDKDRVLVKADGELTYFASDTAYYVDKRGARLRRLHLPARRRPPRLRQPAAGGRGLRGRRPRPQHRGPHRPARQDVQGRRGGPALQAGRQHHHARGPRRRGRRRRGALLADPLPGRQPADPRPRPARVSGATTTRSSTCSTRTPGSPRCCATPPTSASTGAPPTSTRRCSTTSASPRCSALSASSRGWSATAAELREPHRVARYLEELATATTSSTTSCRVLPLRRRRGRADQHRPALAVRRRPADPRQRPRDARCQRARPHVSRPPLGTSYGRGARIRRVAFPHARTPRRAAARRDPGARGRPAACRPTPRRCTRSTRSVWPRNAARADGDGLQQRAIAIAGLDVRDLAAEFGTPLFVLDEADFRARAAAFREAYADADVPADVFYAGKAFLSAARRALGRRGGARPRRLHRRRAR